MPNPRPSLPPDPRAAALHELLRRAGDEALARFHRAAARPKPDGSQVTDADLAAEEVLVEGLARTFPGDGIITEEHGAVVPSSTGATWYVDPLDGTEAFLEGLAHWGPTVARVEGRELDVGAFWVPRLEELWFAARGGGAWRDDVRLRPVEPAASGRDPILYLPSRSHRVGPLPWPGKTRSLGSTAAHLALVASGGAAAAVVTRWEPWDVGAGLLMVREAGRTIADLSGAPFDPMKAPPAPFLATAGSTLDELLGSVRAALKNARRT